MQSYTRFATLLEIKSEGGPRVPLRLTPIQRQRARKWSNKDIILKPRRIGSTTDECARDVHHFLSHRGASVVTVVPSDKDGTAASKVADIYRIMFEALERRGLRIEFTKRNQRELAIKSRDATLQIIDAGVTKPTAEKKGRGDMITRFHGTEAAFWQAADSTFKALMPCLTADGEAVVESTPNGATGHFWEMCQAAREGKSSYQLIFFPWTAHEDYRVPLSKGEKIEPETAREKALVAMGATAEQLKWRRNKLASVEFNGNEDKFDQEYPIDPETCFLVGGRMFFDADRLLALRHATKLPLYCGRDWYKDGDGGALSKGLLRLWGPIEAGATYVLGGDVAEGVLGGDLCGATIRKRSTLEHIGTLMDLYGFEAFAEDVHRLSRLFRRHGARLIIAIERNNHGHACLLWLNSHLRTPDLFIDRDSKAGWLTSPHTRGVSLDLMGAAVRGGLSTYSTPDPELVGQLRTFVVWPDGVPRATQGAKDDLVLADMVCMNVCSRATLTRDVEALAQR